MDVVVVALNLLNISAKYNYFQGTLKLDNTLNSHKEPDEIYHSYTHEYTLFFLMGGYLKITEQR